MIRTAAIVFVYVSLLIEFSFPGACQTGAVLEDYFKNFASDALGSNRVAHAVVSPYRSSTPGFSTSRCRNPFFFFEPPAKGGFPRSGDAGDEEVHGAVSLAFFGQAGNAAGCLYMIWKAG